MKKIKAYFSKDIFALEALSTVLAGILLATVYSLFNTTILQIILFGLLEAVLCIPFVILCHFTNSHRKIGTLLCLLVYGGLLFGLGALNYPGILETQETFVQWLVQDMDDVGWSMYYGLILCIGGAMFFGTCCYYFTVLRYRFGMLVVVSIIPCVLYAKAIADVKNWYLVFIAGMNLIIAVVRQRYDKKTAAAGAEGLSAQTVGSRSSEKVAGQTDKPVNARLVGASAIVVVVFAAIVLLIGAAIPKQEDAIYYDTFEDTFLGGDTNSELRDASGSLSDLSGNADGYRSNSNRRIYRVNGTSVSYLKRQNFDIYNYEQDRWYADDEWGKYGYSDSEWKEMNSYHLLSELQRAIALADELEPGFAEKYGLEGVINNERITSQGVNINVSSLNFAAEYYIVPPGTTTVIPSDTSESAVNMSGSYVRTDGKHAVNYSYTVTYINDRKNLNRWIEMGGSLKNTDEASKMISELWYILLDAVFNNSEREEEARKCSKAVISYMVELDAAKSYRIAVEDNAMQVSDRVRELAEEITAGCEYDWEKAQALQEYFHKGDFVYDIEYYPPDNSVEYFLFESKRGTCSDYATAYVVMARSVGLTVRYAEGYLAKPSVRADGMRQHTYQTYYIKESNGHAFPEVFLPSYGWAVFEPTSGIVAEDGNRGFWEYLFLNINMDYDLMLTIGIIVASIAVLIIIVRLIIPFILEQVFVHKLRTGKKTATDAYRKILKRVKGSRLKKKYRKLVNRDKLVIGMSPYAMAPAELKAKFDEINIDTSVMFDEVEKDAYRMSGSSEYRNESAGAGRTDASAKKGDYSYSLQNEICIVYKNVCKIFK